jgi:hypothetical protein
MNLASLNRGLLAAHFTRHQPDSAILSGSPSTAEQTDTLHQARTWAATNENWNARLHYRNYQLSCRPLFTRM